MAQKRLSILLRRLEAHRAAQKWMSASTFPFAQIRQTALGQETPLQLARPCSSYVHSFHHRRGRPETVLGSGRKRGRTGEIRSIGSGSRSPKFNCARTQTALGQQTRVGAWLRTLPITPTGRARRRRPAQGECEAFGRWKPLASRVLSLSMAGVLHTAPAVEVH